jgi:hypothetical protein
MRTRSRVDAKAVRLTTHADHAALVEDYDTFLFDCDGTIWNGDALIDGIVEVLDMLRKKGDSIGREKYTMFIDLLLQARR